MYVYERTEWYPGKLFTVGWYDWEKLFHPEGNYKTVEEAEERVKILNAKGGW
jgi:hypothetical protein